MACGTDHAETGPDATQNVPRATWYQDVAPIMSTHCMSCHQDGGVAPFVLTDYDSAKDSSPKLLAKIDANEMPPFNASEDSDCTPRFGWKDDPRLSAAEKATLHAWIEDGMSAGTARPVSVPEAPTLLGVTETVAPIVPFTARGDRDQFMCFLLDPQLTQFAWLTGLQVRPGNANVVHHVVISEIQAGPELVALEQAHGVGLPFDCGQMTQPGFALNIWTPGNQPMETPQELAIPMFAHAKVVMQIHYHPAGQINAPDATKIDLRISSVWPKRMYFVGAFGNAATAPLLFPEPDDTIPGIPEFAVPATKADHIETMLFPIADLGGLNDVRIYSVNPHMHLVGTHINGRIIRPAARGDEPKNECLANGAWNFDWQRTYSYDTSLELLPSIQVGDQLEISCHWNNTMENPFVQRMLHDTGLVAPTHVTLGEQTTNEMCLEIFGLSIEAPPNPIPREVESTVQLVQHMLSMAARAR